MKRKNKKYMGGGTGICLIFIIFAIAITVFYNHREETGKYKFSHTYYIHDKGIAEYSRSAMVSFPIRGDYNDLVGKDVYYYDDNDVLKKGNLESISLSDKRFSVGTGELNTEKFLGQATGGVGVLGSLIDFFTSNFVYIGGVVVPGILCVLYEVYVVVVSLKEEKN